VAVVIFIIIKDVLIRVLPSQKKLQRHSMYCNDKYSGGVNVKMTN